MTHSDVEELLAAYALDAVDPAEALAVEAHVAECSRCRAEVARHRELASMFSSSPEEAPAELWQRISGALAEPDPEYGAPLAIAQIAPIGAGRRVPRRITLANGLLAGVAAVAAVVVIVMAVQISHLNGQVAQMQDAIGSKGLASAVATALVEPHQEAVLSSATGKMTAEVVITPSGEAYWVHSSLPQLKAAQTYQLWALVNGKPVSIGLIGRDPSGYSAFRIGPGSAALMVTAEPAGGTPSPTTRVLLRQTIDT
ncbi:MAG: anti-sigma factor domain-containing protein [Acidimicrobiales bacterium]|jgi:anti-sigma factor RsiW